MPEPISRRPLQEFDLRNGLGPQPNAFLHFLGGQFVAPPRFVRVGQIGEGHDGRDKMTNSLEDLTAGCRNETIANASNVHQIFSLVNTNDERVESVRTRNVSAYDELLAPIYAVLYPRGASFSSFIQAVLALSDNTFQLLFAHSSKHVICCNVELFSNAYAA